MFLGMRAMAGLGMERESSARKRIQNGFQLSGLGARVAAAVNDQGRRSEEHTLNSSHTVLSRMPSSA